jgi:trk system potassium uptake protein TrkH
MGSSVKTKYLRTYSNQIILASFIIIILISAWLLKLPACSNDLTFFEALFTATSSACVTGLTIVDIDRFTIVGQCIIMCLIQVGGIGLMTLSFFLVTTIYKELSVGGKSLAKDFLSLNSVGKIKEYLTLIIKMTIITELIASLILFSQFIKTYSFESAFFSSIFYSISAFCNAGVILDQANFTFCKNNNIIMIVIQCLIIIGGLGFFVFYEIINSGKKFFRDFLKDKPMPARNSFLSLHSNIVIKTSLLLTVVGTLFFLAIEKNNLFINESWLAAFFKSLFHNISLRSAGFSIFKIHMMSDASVLFSMVCMMIGASPGSTGGGIKTTTFAILMATFSSIISGKRYVEIGRRTIFEQQIYKSASILAISISWIIGATFLLLLIEKQHSFLDIFFETCSSLSNVGLSTGITKSLSTAGQVILMINMLAGRIGILTFIFAVQRKKTIQQYKYPSEEIILG